MLIEVEAYSDPCQKIKMELFAKIVNNFQSMDFFAKIVDNFQTLFNFGRSSTLVVWQGSELASVSGYFQVANYKEAYLVSTWSQFWKFTEKELDLSSTIKCLLLDALL